MGNAQTTFEDTIAIPIRDCYAKYIVHNVEFIGGEGTISIDGQAWFDQGAWTFPDVEYLPDGFIAKEVLTVLVKK